MNALPFPLIPGYGAMDSLSLWMDGATPAAWRDAAKHHDANHPPHRTAARVRLINLKPKAAAVIAIMATAMEKAAAREGCVTRDELLALGLSPKEVDAHARSAFRLACTRTPGLAALEPVS
jgi:hypothetical protein